MIRLKQGIQNVSKSLRFYCFCETCVIISLLIGKYDILHSIETISKWIRGQYKNHGIFYKTGYQDGLSASHPADRI